MPSKKPSSKYEEEKETNMTSYEIKKEEVKKSVLCAKAKTFKM